MQVGSESHYGHGKLLLTSEYFVLKGAMALAVPTQKGQKIDVRYGSSFNPILNWKSYDHCGKLWFEANFEFWKFNLLDGSKYKTLGKPEDVIMLQKILREARRQNPHFLRDEVEVFVETHLEFPVEWGLGSSSTLITILAQWAHISPFELLFKTFGGSGYDVACAQTNGPILYEKRSSGPHWQIIEFDPSFKKQLFFVYLEKKQDSQAAIKYFNQRMNEKEDTVNELVIKLSALTREMVECHSIEDFQFFINAHEELVSQHLGLPAVKDLYFSDFKGAIKSLGAWGGDFVLAASAEKPERIKNYFKKKGYASIVSYEEMVLNSNKAKHEYIQ